ncbi:MAG: ATP-binding domain-containing protein, partial [Firmicutes bacterium]|nr:ATP-binding domain-containing protein [Bacillota bacterium]
VLPDGTKPVYSHVGSQTKEAHWIAEKIRALAEAGTPLNDIAVLYRAHYITRNIEEVFLKEKLPYKIYSGVQFFDRMEIKDTLSYLRMLAYKDDLSFRRIANVPKRNLGQRRMQFLEETAEKEGCSLYQALQRHLDDEIFKGTKAAKFVSLIERFAKLAESMPISELFAKLADESGYEAMLRTEGSQERLDNLAELKQSILEYEISCGEETSLQHYLEHVALFSNAEQPVADGKVKLMTIHAAKGLEFPYVFLCALNEDVFPSKKVSTLEAMEEERRLAFVAVTRAQEALYLSDAEGRTIEGTQRYPSRFLFDTGFELLDVENAPPDDLVRDAKELISVRLKHMPENLARTALPEGTRVRHEIFGEGTILDFDAGAGVYVIQFDMLDTPRRLNARLKLEML